MDKGNDTEEKPKKDKRVGGREGMRQRETWKSMVSENVLISFFYT